MRSDIRDWLVLSAIDGVGPKRLKILVDKLGSPKAVLDAPLERLQTVEKIDERTARKIVGQERNYKFADEQLNIAQKQNIDIITYKDESFPKSLLNIYDPPVFLFVRGNIEEEIDKNAMAVVGSRSPTIYGKTITEQIAKELATRGITIVSGMARGIDSQAHKGALMANGRTIAVLGCGVDIVYPPENHELMHKIAENGAVVSEYPIGTKPNASNFPGRNRIISGLSLGVLVTEARKGSGALITVDFATEQGRLVFAVPGQITSKMSKGSNRLIKDGAKLVESVEDVLVELKPLIGLLPEQKEKAEELNLPDDERDLFEFLSNEPIHVDKLSQKTGLSTQQILTILLSLELKGIVKSLPGKKFIAI